MDELGLAVAFALVWFVGFWMGYLERGAQQRDMRRIMEKVDEAVARLRTEGETDGTPEDRRLPSEIVDG